MPNPVAKRLLVITTRLLVIVVAGCGGSSGDNLVARGIVTAAAGVSNKGRLAPPRGQPASGVLVVVNGPQDCVGDTGPCADGPRVGRVTTDAQGQFAIRVPRRGPYTFRALRKTPYPGQQPYEGNLYAGDVATVYLGEQSSLPRGTWQFELHFRQDHGLNNPAP